MPNKNMGLKRKNATNSENRMDKNMGYMGGGITPQAPMSSMYRKGGKFNMGGGTEMGKESKSYKEYVKEMFGGGMTSEPAMKKKK